MRKPKREQLKSAVRMSEDGDASLVAAWKTDSCLNKQGYVLEG